LLRPFLGLQRDHVLRRIAAADGSKAPKAGRLLDEHLSATYDRLQSANNHELCELLDGLKPLVATKLAERRPQLPGRFPDPTGEFPGRR
jgi:hypothetical protein